MRVHRCDAPTCAARSGQDTWLTCLPFDTSWSNTLCATFLPSTVADGLLGATSAAVSEAGAAGATGAEVGPVGTRSMSKLMVSPSTEVTVTLTSNGASPLVARQTTDCPTSPLRSLGQSAVSVPSWLLIWSSTLSFVATLPQPASVTTSARTSVPTDAARRGLPIPIM